MATVMPKSVSGGGWPYKSSPFHAEELAVQDRLGVRGRMDAGARKGIRDFLPNQHRQFFAQLPFLIVGTVDQDGQPWASIVTGRPGFVSSPDPRQLRVTGGAFRGDPMPGALLAGAPVAVLGIEPHTRRRNRMNGTIVGASEDGFGIEVGQSYGNCPQNIQGRIAEFLTGRGDRVDPSSVARYERLTEADRELLSRADTFFIASANLSAGAGAARGVDVSHRGGRPGFVRVDDATLTTPDFVGNFFFNTIGNLMADSRCGLLFVDFETGDLLQLTAQAQITWDDPEIAAFAGAERLLRFDVTGVVRAERAVPFAWSRPEFAVELARTGTWDEAATAIAAKRLRDAWRPYRIEAIHDESETMRSFELVPADGNGLLPFDAGQFLTLRVPAGLAQAPVVRSYTLSDAPDGRKYRISVQRDGVMSTWLHREATVGGTIDAISPSGAFTFDYDSRRPILLLSAGAGITPMIAFLNALMVNDMRTRHANRVYFIHGATNGRQHAFADHVRHKASKHSNLQVHVAYSQPLPEDEAGISHDSVGRVDIDLLKRLLPLDDYDAYVCGPGEFVQSTYDGLRAVHVPDGQVRTETFGNSAVRRSPDQGPASRLDAAVGAAEVTFAKSGKSVSWTGPETLLELAEANGVEAPFGCRSGVCGSCMIALLTGEVDYPTLPTHRFVNGQVLTCCAHRAPTTDLSPDGATKISVSL